MSRMASQTPKLIAKWTRILKGPVPELTRSSHALAVAGDKAYVFGGELKPRTPIDNQLHVIDLSGSKLLQPIPTSLEARVGATTTVVNDVIYVWGGRGGKDMAPLLSSRNIHAFDIARGEWNSLELKEVNGEAEPEDRSYHVLTSIKDKLYLHAGCPAKGRLSTLHSLNISSPSPSWTSLASAPDPPRGGTVLAPDSSRYLLRFGGFSGYEIGGNLDVYDTQLDKWCSYDLSKNGEVPKARSVHALIPVDSKKRDLDQVVALMLFGELDPAPVELGHDGAGKFSNEIWALVSPRGSDPNDPEGFEKFSWVKVEGEGEAGGEWPEARGWFGASAWADGKVVVIGGLNGRNERLGDSWVLEVSKAA